MQDIYEVTDYCYATNSEIGMVAVLIETKWVLLKAGVKIDSDQYRHDLFERNNLRVYPY